MQGFTTKIRPLRSGAWRFYREPSGSDLAEKRHDRYLCDTILIRQTEVDVQDGNVERYNGRI